MREPTSNAYDDVRYPSAALAQTHPDRLATIATLFGLSPTPVGRCRVLELGCGDGANLIPMAFDLADSEFLGVDLAARPVAEGQALIAALGLKNIRLQAANLLELASSWGRFDYIIAHGLYAWVPAAIQDKLLTICHENLAPNGVAYMSYNTYPGSHIRRMMREMMLFHLRQQEVPRPQMENEAKALARLLAGSRGRLDAFQELTRAAAEEVLDYAEGHLFHDELAATFSPVYFHEFLAHAARHRLQYLAEADFFEMQDRSLPPAVCEELQRVAPTRLLREQYLDFLKCRRFRQTLLVHLEAELHTDLDARLVPRFWFSSQAQPASPEPDFSPQQCERFVGKHGAAMETDHALTKAAICVLGRAWPHRLSFDELLAQSENLAGEKVQADADEVRTFCEILLQTFTAGLVQFHLHSPAHAKQPGQRPVASALARRQIEHGDVVTNLYHQPVKVEGLMARALLLLLDGSRHRFDVCHAMAALVQEDGMSSSPPDLHLIAGQLDQQLVKLAQLGLLVT